MSDQEEPELLAPSLADFERLAKKALTTIPDELRAHAASVVIRVEEFPDEEVEDEMELESPFDLLGLYRGTSLPDKSATAPSPNADLVFIYRRPILDFWCETGEDLGEIVRHVLIHEIGHHFGFSDTDMERLEDEEDDED